jgi:hypothetical protein
VLQVPYFLDLALAYLLDKETCVNSKLLAETYVSLSSDAVRFILSSSLVKQEKEPMVSSLAGLEACTVPDQPQLPERRVRIA